MFVNSPHKRITSAYCSPSTPIGVPKSEWIDQKVMITMTIPRCSYEVFVEPCVELSVERYWSNSAVATASAQKTIDAFEKISIESRDNPRQEICSVIPTNAVLSVGSLAQSQLVNRFRTSFH
ncbi:hypothetical protein Tco_0418643 [Tanacetum coccineum]